LYYIIYYKLHAVYYTICIINSKLYSCAMWHYNHIINNNFSNNVDYYKNILIEKYSYKCISIIQGINDIILYSISNIS